MSFKPKTTDQLRAIFGLGRKVHMAKEDLEELACDVTNGRVERLSLLSFDEANAIISRLGGDPFPLTGSTPTRTANYRKQKAGVETIETQKQIKLIRDLAAKRNMSDEGLDRLCMRVIKETMPPSTTKKGNKIVEALKAMNKRTADTPVRTSASRRSA